MEDTVYTKLAKDRKAFKNSNVKKSGENKFQGYKYFELSDILNAVTDINESIGLATVAAGALLCGEFVAYAVANG